MFHANLWNDCRPFDTKLLRKLHCRFLPKITVILIIKVIEKQRVIAKNKKLLYIIDTWWNRIFFHDVNNSFRRQTSSGHMVIPDLNSCPICCHQVPIALHYFKSPITRSNSKPLLCCVSIMYVLIYFVTHHKHQKIICFSDRQTEFFCFGSKYKSYLHLIISKHFCSKHTT